MRALVVTQTFGDFAKGDIITDKATVEDLIGSDYAPNFVVTDLDDPAPPAKAAPAPAPAPALAAPATDA